MSPETDDSGVSKPVCHDQELASVRHPTNL
jgi:hypothetical protein